MTDGKSQERLDRIEELIAQMAANTLASQRANDEYRARFEQQIGASHEQISQFRQEFQQELREAAAASHEQMGQFRQEFQQELREAAAASHKQMGQFRQEFQQELREAAAASYEHRVWFEQELAASNERLNRIEQLVESNNRFLEAFSVELRGYIQAMDNMTQRQNGIIATSNQDRQDANSRLGSIQRRVDAIARHLGVDG